MKRLSIFIIALLTIGMCPPYSFSQEAPEDATANELVHNFLSAVNNGEREVMHDFITQHYDPMALRMIPVSTVVTLNSRFYHETGGMGYDLLKIYSPEENQIIFELQNKLTEAHLKFTLPTSGPPSYRINRLIKTELILPLPDAQKISMTDEEIVRRIEQCLAKLEGDEEFSGAFLLAKNGEVLLKKAIGMASKSYGVPNRTDTKFNIASVGKMFTGLAVTQLVEQGKLSFDDPVSKFVSSDWLDPAISSKMEIRHLLTHTSGLGDYFRDAYGQCEVPFFKDLKDYQSLTVDDTLLFEPGTRFSYSNTGMLLLGIVIEKVTGEEYFQYLQKNIFEPAGMRNTDGYPKDIPVDNRATGYTKVFEDGAVTWNNHQFTRILKGSPSGGVYSTVEDLLMFDIALRANQLLSIKYTETLLQGRPELNVSFHGYAFFNSEGPAGRVLSHQGDGRGMNCHFKLFRDTGYTVVVLSNYSRPSANIVARVVDQLLAIAL